MMAAAITRGSVTLTNVCPEHMTAILEKLREIGLRIVVGDDTVHVTAESPLRPVECIALPYPGHSD